MKILLTGGSGFLGSYVAEKLAAAGHAVRALVRPKSERRFLEKLPLIELATGSVEDRASLDAAVAGVDAVVHVAGIVKARKPAEFFAVNEGGTRNLLDACLARGGVKRFVHVSSLAAVGPSRDGTPVPENAEPKPVTHYGRSKLLAEQAVLAVADRMPVTVIRPPMIYGPRDRETLAFFSSVKNGVLPMMGDGLNTLSVIYGEDCADAIARAAVSLDAPSGRTYFVEDGQVLVWKEALKDVEAAMGKRAFVRVGVPMGAIKVAAAASQLWGKVTGTAQMLTLDKVNELTQPHWVCSGDGARRDLGWAPRTSWAQGVRAAADWYRAEGWL